jgi:hypothetical protein
MIKFPRCITKFNLGKGQVHFKNTLLKLDRFDVFTNVSLYDVIVNALTFHTPFCALD